MSSSSSEPPTCGGSARTTLVPTTYASIAYMRSCRSTWWNTSNIYKAKNNRLTRAVYFITARAISLALSIVSDFFPDLYFSLTKSRKSIS